MEKINGIVPTVDANEYIELLLNGANVKSLCLSDNIALEEYNKIADYFETKKLPQIDDLSANILEKASTWNIPDYFLNLDVEEYITSLCLTDEEKNRINKELVLYKEKNLFRLLQCLIYIVDTFRKNNVVWGVGRGSSVSSYCLFLIGVHKIDSIKYGLEIEEFLK